MEKQNYRNPHPYLSQFCYDASQNSTENVPLQQNSRNRPTPGLYEQFEKLKQKIQSVQVRNEQIIERIRNFRKNNVYSEQESRAGEFQHPHTADQLESQYSQLSQSGTYFGYNSPSSNRTHTTPNVNYNNFSQSNNGNNFHHFPIPIEEPQNINVKPPKKQKRSKSRSKAKSPNSAMGKKKKTAQLYTEQDEIRNCQIQSLLNSQKVKVAQMKRQIQRLEELNSQLKNVQNKYRSYVLNTKYIIQNNLINFFQGVIKGNLNQIDRNFKKNQLKLLNLSVQIRQAREDHKSNKMLRDHRLKRSTSRSKALTPTPRNNFSKTDLNKSMTKTQDVAKKNKQFQQIANKYQDIIKMKNEQIQSFDNKYKQKQQQVEKLKLKIEQLNKDILQNDNKIKQQYQITSKKYENQIKQLREVENSLQIKIKELQREKKDIQNTNLKIDKLQLEIYEKDNIINSLKQVNASYECKIISLQSYEKSTTQTNISMQRIISDLQNKTKALSNAEEQNGLLEKKLMEIECQLYGVTNRLKKSQQAVQMKEKKIQQLQKLLQQNEDLHQRSLFAQSINNFSSKINPIKAQQVKHIVKELEKVEEQLENKKSENLILNKQKDIALAKITDLQEKITVLKKSNEMLEEENQALHKRVQQEKVCVEDSLQDEEERKKIEQDLFEAMEKCNTLSKTIQNLRNENLEINSKLMKSQSQLQFVKDSLAQKEQFSDKIKLDNQNLREQKLALQKKLSQLQYETQIQRKENQQRIKQLEDQSNQLQEKMYEVKADYGQDLVSQRSMNIRNDFTHLATQNELLNEKLKEKDAIIESLNIMEKKIIQEYRINVEKVKTDIRDKNNIIEKLNSQLSKAKKRISTLQTKEGKVQSINNKQSELQDQIQDLEKQLKETKDLYEKATQMYGQLIEQLRSKQDQKAELMRQIQFKNLRIHQFQQILEVKESHNISKASLKSKMLPKQSFILNMRASQTMGQGLGLYNYIHEGSMLKHQGTIDFQLSVAEQSFLENSHLNVSQLFKDFPHDKMKLRKKQHRLFEKTAAYITSLKQNIEEKNKKIRTLQKKIQSLKSSELIRKQYDISGKELYAKDQDLQGQFKDYQSENLQNCKGRSHRKMKALENDTRLIIQENNMLVQQIDHLQDQLQRAEQQQNSLMKIKDLYKDEIKKLMKKLDDQTKAFDEQLQKQRKKVQDSQSVHNYQQLRQLFIKLCTILNKPTKKKEQKKKQLNEHAKLICNILNMDQGQRNTITNLFSKTD